MLIFFFARAATVAVNVCLAGFGRLVLIVHRFFFFFFANRQHRFFPTTPAFLPPYLLRPLSPCRYTYRHPLGVTAAIAPFNFPAMIPLWTIPVALACGNTHVLKPSERVPGASIRLAELALEAGVPAGVLNIIHGGHAAVDHILDSPHVRAISFVGSNTAGEYIHRRGSANGIRVQANLGAKNHGIVMPDAHYENTVNALVGAGFGAAGQRCMALSTLVMVGDAKHWVEDLARRAKELKVGNGAAPGTDIGPVISHAARDRINGLIQSAWDEGAEVVLDGRDPVVPGCEGGAFVGPTVLGKVTPEMRAYKEEIFGPVVCILEADTLEDAMRIVNANPYGNGASIFTRSGAAARHFQRNIEAGQVGINTPIPVPLPTFSFTGNKASIRGDLNFYGQAGINFFTQWKSITSTWKEDLDGSAMAMPILGAAKK
jgi:malonate-semialdehyde dehydrogenase (acetylating)/methylmalonate-semialdehyde dehydrogenase